MWPVDKIHKLSQSWTLCGLRIKYEAKDDISTRFPGPVNCPDCKRRMRAAEKYWESKERAAYKRERELDSRDRAHNRFLYGGCRVYN